jgi:hypothetical protein
MRSPTGNKLVGLDLDEVTLHHVTGRFSNHLFSLFRDKIKTMSQHKPKHAPNRQAATNPALALAIRSNVRSSKQARKKQPIKVRKPQPKKFPMNSMQPAYKHISECALMYASALCDPENTSEGACVPYGFPTPSMKQKSFTRGTFQLGTTGQGYIQYTPNVTNDGPAITTTSVTSAGTAASALNAFTNTTQTSLTKQMFSTANLVTNKLAAGRIVAGGIKIRYAGTEANRNGTMTALEEPNHLDLSLLTGTQIRGYINSFVERPDPLGSFYSIAFSGPVTALETQFQNIATPMGNPIAIFVDGIAGDKYEFELYQHVEYVGQNVPGVSASHADPVAYAQIIDATKAVTVSEPLSDKNAPSTFRRFLNAAGSTINGILKSHGPDLFGMISNALLPGSGMFTRALVRENNRLAIKG